MSNFVSISAARNNLPSLVDKVNKNMERVTITVHGQPAATLINQNELEHIEDELEAIQETAEIMAIPGALESIKRSEEQVKKGQVVPFEKVVGKTADEILNE